MLGLPKPRRLDEPITASLNDLVPPDHVSRHLKRTLDLTFVRDLVRDTYGAYLSARAGIATTAVIRVGEQVNASAAAQG